MIDILIFYDYTDKDGIEHRFCKDSVECCVDDVPEIVREYVKKGCRNVVAFDVSE